MLPPESEACTYVGGRPGALVGSFVGVSLTPMLTRALRLFTQVLAFILTCGYLYYRRPSRVPKIRTVAGAPTADGFSYYLSCR